MVSRKARISLPFLLRRLCVLWRAKEILVAWSSEKSFSGMQGGAGNCEIKVERGL